MATEIFAGPIDYVAFAFPPGADVGAGLAIVLQRVDAGHIEILDIEHLGIRDGVPARLPLGGLPAHAFDLSVFDGAESRILDDDDLGVITAALDPGWFALVIVYEDRSLARAAQAWTDAGGVELLVGGVDAADLDAILDDGSDR